MILQYDEEMCANLAVLWASDTLQETYPGFRSKILSQQKKIAAGSLTWVAHREAPMDGRYTAFFVNLQFNSTVSNSKGWPVALPGIGCQYPLYKLSSYVSILCLC